MRIDKNNKIGRSIINNQGLKMSVLEYRTYRDIDVQFEDGTIIKTSFNKFITGVVRYPYSKLRIGEQSVATNGMKITIVNYRSNTDIDIEFEDGTLKTGVKYGRFKSGRIAYTPNRLGETSINKNGMQMTIIKYNNANNVDIKFEDGTVIRHTKYCKFAKGLIGYPNIDENGNITRNYSPDLSEKRIGLVALNKLGRKIKIIRYANSRDIDVQFEDGIIIEHRKFDDFKKGRIDHPDDKHIRMLKNKVGEQSIARNGLKMTIVVYRNYDDIDIQFEDGVIVKNTHYSCFKSGGIKHPTKNAYIKDRTGKVLKGKQEINMQVVGYRNWYDIDVELEDGTLINNTRYKKFIAGTIKHPNFLNVKKAYEFKNEKFFICTCKKCGNKHVLKLSEMKDFECEVI